MLRTGQDYLDGWVLDYNFFKKHEALKGATPAEYVGIDHLVPWDDSWGDITRMGGEIAEPRIKDVVIDATQARAEAEAQQGLEDIESRGTRSNRQSRRPRVRRRKSRRNSRVQGRVEAQG